MVSQILVWKIRSEQTQRILKPLSVLVYSNSAPKTRIIHWTVFIASVKPHLLSHISKSRNKICHGFGGSSWVVWRLEIINHHSATCITTISWIIISYIHNFSQCKDFVPSVTLAPNTWWRHQMEIFSTLPVRCAGNSPVTAEFPSQGPVTRSFGVFFDLRLNKRLSKQSRQWWFETPSRLL